MNEKLKAPFSRSHGLSATTFFSEQLRFLSWIYGLLFLDICFKWLERLTAELRMAKVSAVLVISVRCVARIHSPSLTSGLKYVDILVLRVYCYHPSLDLKWTARVYPHLGNESFCNTIFKGYTSFTVITIYWLYSPCSTIYPCSLLHTIVCTSYSPTTILPLTPSPPW